MIGATNGWALGADAVLHTADGGRTWTDASPPDVAMSSDYPYENQTVDFLDASTGWVAGRSGANLMLWRTADGGRTWKSTVIRGDPAGMSAQVSFPDAEHGWLLLHMAGAMGSEGVAVLHTRDGGATWTRVAQTKPPDPEGQMPFGGDKTGLTFRADGTGWVTTNSAVDDRVDLYVTHDGGIAWQDQWLPMPASTKPFGGSLTTYPPLFFSDADGLLPIMKSDGRVLFFATHDGGKQWVAGAPVPTSNGIRGIWDFVNARQGWIWTGVGLETTDDGGKTWTELATTPALRDVRQLDFMTDQIGWAVLNGGQLLKTTDGGSTWQTP